MWDEVRGLRFEVWGLGFEVWGLGSTLTVDDGLSEGKTTAQLSLKRFEVGEGGLAMMTRVMRFEEWQSAVLELRDGRYLDGEQLKVGYFGRCVHLGVARRNDLHCLVACDD